MTSISEQRASVVSPESKTKTNKIRLIAAKIGRNMRLSGIIPFSCSSLMIFHDPIIPTTYRRRQINPGPHCAVKRNCVVFWSASEANDKHSSIPNNATMRSRKNFDKAGSLLLLLAVSLDKPLGRDFPLASASCFYFITGFRIFHLFFSRVSILFQRVAAKCPEEQLPLPKHSMKRLCARSCCQIPA